MAPNTIRFRILEKNMETTIVYWSYIGKTEKKMETTPNNMVVSVVFFCFFLPCYLGKRKRVQGPK